MENQKVQESCLATGLLALTQSRRFKDAFGLKENETVALTFLAQGEYNRNYTFVHPHTGQKFVLRINFHSQTGMKDQILYEYHALEILAPSGRTPLPVWVDDSREYMPWGVLAESFLPGERLDYKTQLFTAVDCLADIHSVPVQSADGLVPAGNGLSSILAECRQMFRTYEDSPLADEGVKKRIQKLLAQGEEALRSFDPTAPYLCCVNTEVNNSNFLVYGGRACLVDWEKPVYGEPAQDLGHFLAPTTTFWKTDVILTPKQTNDFISAYEKAVRGRFDTRDLRERTWQYIRTTCLRGLTWCAMAWVQYHEGTTALRNKDTAVKLDAYLSDSYLRTIENFLEKDGTEDKIGYGQLAMRVVYCL